MSLVTKTALAMLVLVTSWSFDSQAGAQSPSYQKVESGRLLDGGIPNDAWIETTGYTWFTGTGVIFNFNQPSARVPMHIDVANVDPETIRQLRSQCGSREGLGGGCWATIRGQTAMLNDRQGIVAREIQVMPNGEKGTSPPSVR